MQAPQQAEQPQRGEGRRTVQAQPPALQRVRQRTEFTRLLQAIQDKTRFPKMEFAKLKNDPLERRTVRMGQSNFNREMISKAKLDKGVL